MLKFGRKMPGNKNVQPAGFVSACGKVIEKKVAQLQQNHPVVMMGRLSTTSHHPFEKAVISLL